jgi:hypothetical protein
MTEWTPQLLLFLGVGFLVANVRVGLDAIRFLRRRSSAVLTWRGPRPRYYGLQLALGVALGLLLAYDLIVLRRRHGSWIAAFRSAPQMFGIGMMFLYYGYLVPLSRRIGRGFYADGIWSEAGFVPYWKIGAVSWREGEEVALIIVTRLKNFARRLVVPGVHYGAARRLLREKIAAHDIELLHTGLELGVHDARDDV